MRIGGIDFVIKNNTSSGLKEPEPFYQAFIETIEGLSDTDPFGIQVNLEMGHLPVTENLIKLFDGDHSWVMFKESDNYLLSRHPPAFERPFWLARINPRFTKATVFINNGVIRTKDGHRVIENPVRYPFDQILLMYILAPKKGALLHAAGVNLNGKGCIFPGKSGAGKSTITKQFAAVGKTHLLSDDRIIVRKIDGGFKAYGTPWPGEAGIALNESMPLSSIFFLNHGTTNRIKPIKPRQALERLMPVTSIPWYDKDVIPKILDFCEDLVFNVPAYVLDFKPSVEVAHVLEQFFSN